MDCYKTSDFEGTSSYEGNNAIICPYCDDENTELGGYDECGEYYCQNCERVSYLEIEITYTFTTYRKRE